eukprot:TRINITY_DN4208_c0_g1_i1.p1 TRINITY_DN4208_c0_g1~~TRINITY_DN4208_c0_g1_i1.p1  ORF type:complete len:785 (-),score=106.82 TRINITY_DN4208_c0_g1_i1:223-2577(-)
MSFSLNTSKRPFENNHHTNNKKQKTETKDTIMTTNGTLSSKPENDNLTNSIPSEVIRKKVVSQPVKKLVIKNFSKKPELPPDFEAETWGKLKNSVNAIHNSQPTSFGSEELYKAVEDLCCHKMSANLYTKLQKECEDHITSEGNKLLGQSDDSLTYLTLLDTTWQNHCQHMKRIRGIFLYLDRSYAQQNAHIRTLWDMGLTLFRHHVVRLSEVERKTIESVLSLIKRDRLGESVNRSLLKNVLRMLSALQIYHEIFEPKFIEESSQFYAQESSSNILNFETAHYLLHAEQRINEEADRIVQYLDPTTRKPLITCVERQLLELHVPLILEKGFDLLMDRDRRSDLSRMYQLLSRVSGLDKMKISWNAYIKRTGYEIVISPERDSTMVQDLLDFKAKLDDILSDCFHKNDAYAYSLKEAFEYFINSRANKPAELIAKFIDSKLQSGNKTTTEDQMESLLNRLMILFRYIQGKDVFDAFYKKDLAKRLLLGKSASIDNEKAMITKLKQECGSGFTTKLEGMFKDIDTSKDIMTSFKQSTKHKAKGDIELNVFVLTISNWPPYNLVEIKLPEELSDYQEIFKNFYLSKYTGRRLMWHNSLGHCVVKASFPKKVKELSLSLFQTVILLLYQKDLDLQMSYKDIFEATGIEEKELKRTLQSLACGKIRIMTKTPKTKDVEDNDVFSINKDFDYKYYRIKINNIQMKETPEEHQKTTESIVQDRQYQVDAAIVRIMKTRKSLTHQVLALELYQLLKFPLKPVDIKKRIESLIDREYLERDPSNSQLYNYLA